MELEIPILGHTWYDLTKFNFDVAGIKILEIKSDELKQYIHGLNCDPEFQDSNYAPIRHIQKEVSYDDRNYYAIVKNDPKTSYTKASIRNVYNLLLIIFPSDLQILHEIHYYEDDGKFNTSGYSSWTAQITGEYPGEYLYSSDDYLIEINEFISLVFDRSTRDNYISLAIRHYVTSFQTSHYHYQFLTLCMVIEATIPGTNEVTYRIKRNTAVLVGENSHTSKIIFDNLNKIYTLRSKIVHGEKYDHNKVFEYIPYLKSLCSRVVIELLIHNIDDNKILDKRITTLGFGNQSGISSQYRTFMLNIITQTTSNVKNI